MLGDESLENELREEVALALGEIGDRKAVEPLKKFLEDSELNLHYRETIEASLKKSEEGE